VVMREVGCFVRRSDLGACFGAFCCGCRVHRGSCGVESFVHNLEGEAPGKRFLERPRKISCHRILLPRQDCARWWVLLLVLFSCCISGAFEKIRTLLT
jgi:hypothetical protein